MTLSLRLNETNRYKSQTTSPGEIKRREVSWTHKKKLAQKRSRAGRWCWATEREREGWTSSVQLFPNGGATDIVLLTLFCIAVGTAVVCCCGRCAMPDGHCLNYHLVVLAATAALVFRVGACIEVSLFCPPFPLVPVHNRPSRFRGR